MKDLKETINLMNSADYKDRFRAEYYQTKIRYEKLAYMVEKYEKGTLDFKPSCPLKLLKSQLYYMKRYLNILTERAVLEDTNLDEYVEVK